MQYIFYMLKGFNDIFLQSITKKAQKCVYVFLMTAKETVRGLGLPILIQFYRTMVHCILASENITNIVKYIFMLYDYNKPNMRLLKIFIGVCTHFKLDIFYWQII